MKKIFLICLTLSISLIAVSQEKTKQREVGLAFKSVNSFGLTFKTGTNKSLWRFNTLLISGSQMKEKSGSYESKDNTLGFDLKFGHEFRTVIVKNLELRFGADLSFSYEHSETNKEGNRIEGIYSQSSYRKESTIYQPGINLVLGFNYVIADKLVFGAEFLPSFNYTTGNAVDRLYYYGSYNYQPIDSKVDISGFNFGLNSSSVLLSLAYRF